MAGLDVCLFVYLLFISHYMGPEGSWQWLAAAPSDSSRLF